jgi:hypothetical protein
MQSGSSSPRWRWRTFGRDLRPVSYRLGALLRDARVGRETYLLANLSDVIVKIRDDELDVRELQQISASGLEWWGPVFTARFPIPAGAVTALFSVWRARPPVLTRSTYTVEQFVTELASSCPAIRVVEVLVARRAFSVGGCDVEFADLVVNGEVWQTMTIEADDRRRVEALIERLDLGGCERCSSASMLVRLQAASSVACLA